MTKRSAADAEMPMLEGGKVSKKPISTVRIQPSFICEYCERQRAFGCQTMEHPDTEGTMLCRVHYDLYEFLHNGEKMRTADFLTSEMLVLESILSSFKCAQDCFKRAAEHRAFKEEQDRSTRNSTP